LTSINQAAHDEALLARIEAGVWKEAISNPTFGDTTFGSMVLGGNAPIANVFGYPVAVDNEAAYESALAASNPDPGGDPAVITDANIGSGIQAHWPADVISPP
jgi:hypothetical protein